jgi:putative nucleotidyltransferase with HDIG domain
MPIAKPTVFEQLRSADAQAMKERRWHSTLRVLAILLTMGVLATLFPGGSNDSGLAPYDEALLGTIWTDETVVAELSFPIQKQKIDLDRERDSARMAAPMVFRFDSSSRQRSIQSLRRVTTSIADGQSSESDLPRHIADAILALDGVTRKTVTAALREHGLPLVAALHKRGIPDRPIQESTSEVHVVYDDQGNELLVAASAISDSSRVNRMLIAREPGINAVVAAIVAGVIDHVVVPDMRFDAGQTKLSRQRTEASVAQTLGIVERGDVILKKGSNVGSRDLAALSSYRLARSMRGQAGSSILIILGSLIHAGGILSILYLYLFSLRRQSWDSLGQFVGLSSVVVLSAIMAWFSMFVATDIPLQFLIVLPALSMLISVLFDVRMAIILTIVMAFTVAGVRSNDYGIALSLFVAGSLGAYSTNNMQNRTQMFTSMLLISAGLFVTILGVDFERSVPIGLVWPKLAFAAVNAVTSPLIAFAVIIVLEKAFNVATDLRLEEFDNLSHPLLQQLAERAPGTYQHTLAVARLAETAAAAIGGNVVLAKVGALFHDIGKLEKAEYFVENQIDIDNKHDRLTPKRSAAIIRQHVQDGIDLARKADLPDRIIQFIPMHHGTVLIKHFYAKALDETLLKESIVDEQDYRYPGPKPSTREAAIVMLADASEALSRLVDTSSRDELDAAVQQIITDRLSDGQLSMAPLTTADLEKIRESFVKNLIGSTHQRVRYMPIPSEGEPREESKA